MSFMKIFYSDTNISTNSEESNHSLIIGATSLCFKSTRLRFNFFSVLSQTTFVWIKEYSLILRL